MSAGDIKTYAAALLEVAEKPEALRDELFQVAEVIDRVPLVKQVLTDAAISGADRQAVLVNKLLPQFSTLAQRLVGSLVADRQLALLGRIAQQYEELFKAKYGVVNIVIESPVKLSERQRNEIITKFTKRGQRSLVTEHRLPELIGGARIYVDDTVYDYSLGGTLHELEEELLHG